MIPVPLEDVFHRAIQAVETASVPYLVYGGIALPYWGESINTGDVDLVVKVDERSSAALIAAFRAAGFTLPSQAESLLFIDKWMIAQWGARDVDVALGATAFDDEALRRAVLVKIYGRDVPIATAEDLILYKLAAYRFKDLGHVEDIIARQGEKLDRGYLRKWAKEIAEHTGKVEIPQTLEKMLAEAGLK